MRVSFSTLTCLFAVNSAADDSLWRVNIFIRRDIKAHMECYVICEYAAAPQS